MCLIRERRNNVPQHLNFVTLSVPVNVDLFAAIRVTQYCQLVSIVFFRTLRHVIAQFEVSSTFPSNMQLFCMQMRTCKCVMRGHEPRVTSGLKCDRHTPLVYTYRLLSLFLVLVSYSWIIFCIRFSLCRLSHLVSLQVLDITIRCSLYYV